MSNNRITSQLTASAGGPRDADTSASSGGRKDLVSSEDRGNNNTRNMVSKTIGNGKYSVEKEIGKGSFAIVFRGHLANDNNQHLAIKAVSRSKLKNKKLLENLEIEIAILKKIKHPHIVGLIDCERTNTDFYLIMEYCALGDLTFLIKKRKELINTHPLLQKVFEKYPPPSEDHNSLNTAFILNYLQQLASALKFLRSKNLVHRDIKPQNLLLCTPLIDYSDSKTFHELGYVGIYNLPVLKIADFGFARFLPNSSLAETLCGSPLYMAPEILNYQKYNAKADLWSVGTVLFEMGSGHPPFKASNHLELFKKIKKANDIISFPYYFSTNNQNSKDIDNPTLDQDLKDLICKLLTFNPQERISFDEFFDNKLVNLDLSNYELNDDNSIELETKSKNIAESNLFISEYLQPRLQTSINKNPLKQNKNVYKFITPIRNIQHQNSYRSRINSVGRPNDYDNKISTKPPTSSEMMLEKEYVVVEKKTVEVNELADEFAQMDPKLLDDEKFSNVPNQNTTNYYRYDPNRRNSLEYRRPSPLNNRRVSISSLNPTNALSRALGIASTRLFGGYTNQQLSPNSTGNATTALFSSQLFHEMAENMVLKTKDLQTSSSTYNKTNIDDGRDTIIHKLETLSAKSFVVYSYAEVKFEQIVPLQPRIAKRLSTGSCAIDEDDYDRINGHEKRGRVHSEPTNTILAAHDTRNHHINYSDITMNEGLLLVCKEAITLYLKSLELLGQAMQITSKWWYESNERVCSLKLNLLVQWIRDKFNECLEKAEYLRSQLYATESSIFESATGNDECNQVFVEKLLYDRALEISKTAAKMELNGENLNRCELSYATSMWMLQTSLDHGSEGSVLDEQDREIIKKYIDSIMNRLKSLQLKMNDRNENY